MSGFEPAADASIMRPQASWTYLAVASAGALVGAIAANDAVFATLIGASALALVAGVAVNKPRRPWLWLPIAAALAVWAASVATLPNSVLFAHMTFHTFLEARAAAYLLMLGAVVAFLYKTGRVPLGRVDASIAFVGACTLLWPLALEPNFARGTLMCAISALVVLADLGVLTVLLRVSFTPTFAQTAFRLVLGAGTTFAVGDLLNVSPPLAGGVAEHAARFAYLLAAGLVAVAALHPSMRALPTPAAPETPSPRRTVAVISAALFAPFVGMLLNAWVGNEADPYVFGLFGVVLVTAALVRIIGVVHRAHESEQKFRMVFDSAGMGISLGANGMLTETNEAYQRMLGYTGDEMSRMHYDEITYPDDIGIDEELAAEVAAEKRSSYSIEKRYIHRDGTVRWVMVTVTMASDRSFGIGVIEDIDDRKRLEQERQELLARTVEVAEAERAALAADLHDGPIQHLTAVTLTLDLLANKLSRGDVAGAAELAQRLRGSIADEMRSLRRLMAELRPPILDERGLDAALRDCAALVLGEEPIEVTIDSSLNEHRLAPELETAIYRVVREALTNVRKHAGASAVHVTLGTWNGTIGLAIADDGVGFATGSVDDDHVGVLTMRERIESVGGTWRLDTAPGHGTRIQATLPRKLRA